MNATTQNAVRLSWNRATSGDEHNHTLGLGYLIGILLVTEKDAQEDIQFLFDVACHQWRKVWRES